MNGTTRTASRRPRAPSESDVVVELDLDGTGRVDISTGVPSTTTC